MYWWLYMIKNNNSECLHNRILSYAYTCSVWLIWDHAMHVHTGKSWWCFTNQVNKINVWASQHYLTESPVSFPTHFPHILFIQQFSNPFTNFSVLLPPMFPTAVVAVVSLPLCLLGELVRHLCSYILSWVVDLTSIVSHPCQVIHAIPLPCISNSYLCHHCSFLAPLLLRWTD